MKLHYYEDTDSPYIDLADKSSLDSRELSENVVADFDEYGCLIGLDIQHASRHMDLSRIETSHLPLAAKVA